MSTSSNPPKGLFQKILDGIERLGNKVPHPAVLFVGLIALVFVLSHLLQWMEVSATYQRINPETYELEQQSTAVRSMISPEGIRFIFTSVVSNFVTFGPVGIILVAMIGVGLVPRERIKAA